MLLLGARVGCVPPLSLTVFSGYLVFVWLTVEVGRFLTQPSRHEVGLLPAPGCNTKKIPEGFLLRGV